jgi:hypothetical protein
MTGIGFDPALKSAISARRTGAKPGHQPWLIGPGAAALPIAGVNQQRSNWCWAAVAAAVAGYYGRSVDQCALVQTGSWLGRLTASCPNVPGLPTDLTAALDAAGVPAVVVWRPLTYRELTTQIKAGRPVLVVTAKNGNPLSGHVMLARGYKTRTRGVLLADSVLDPHLGGQAAHTSLPLPVRYADLVDPPTTQVVTGLRAEAGGRLQPVGRTQQRWAATILVAPPGREPTLTPAPVHPHRPEQSAYAQSPQGSPAPGSTPSRRPGPVLLGGQQP